MRGPDGKDYFSTGICREIVPMARLVYTDSFADSRRRHRGLRDFWTAVYQANDD